MSIVNGITSDKLDASIESVNDLDNKINENKDELKDKIDEKFNDNKEDINEIKDLVNEIKKDLNDKIDEKFDNVIKLLTKNN